MSVRLLGMGVLLLAVGACGGSEPAANNVQPAGTATAAPPVESHTVAYASARVSVDPPAGWSSKIEGEHFTITDGPGDVAASFVVVPAGAIEAASRAAGAALAHLISDVTIQDDQKAVVNGMNAEFVAGDGRLNGTNIDWMLAVLDTPATDKDLMVIVIAEDAKLAAHKNEVVYLFQHIRPQA